MSTTAAAAPPAATRAVAEVLAQVVDLKRVVVAGASGSWTTRAFLRAWAAVAAGEDAGAVARRETARAVAATRLSGVGAAELRAGGLGDGHVAEVLARAVREGLGGLDVRGALEVPVHDEPPGPAPPFARLLAAQPRAGATAPGRRRVQLHPAETHGDHCLTVAVGAALLVLADGGEPGPAFLSGLAHHLHNATLPDSGFAGEVLLGEHLDRVLGAHREAALAELPDAVAAAARDAAGLALRLDVADARAVVAADTLDRVLEQDWHARSAAFTLEVALDELELVHEGPLQAYGEAALREAGLR